MSERIAGELELLVARRRRTLPVRLGAGLVVLFCLIGTGSLRADPAAAARPVKGALYVQNSDTSAAYLRDSKSGRWLNPRGSAINLDRSVSKCRYDHSPDITYRLGSRREQAQRNAGQAGRKHVMHP